MDDAGKQQTAPPDQEKPAQDSTESPNTVTVETWIREAENGSATHQLQLGSHFLKLAESNVNSEENGAKAVSWLVAASKQGNEEATKKLQHCVETGTGITDKNKPEVTWCINTSLSEKKIRFAARSLFSKLTSTQKAALSKDEYIEAINSLTAGREKERKLLLAAGKKIGSTISENEFVKIVSKKIKGTLTLTAEEMDETTAAYDTAGPLTRIIKYPKQTATVAFDKGLEYASKEGMNLVLSLIPTNQIYLLAMLFAYSYLTPGFFLLVIPLMAFYISILVMVVSTLQMFYKRRKQKDAATLATLLQQQFDTDIDVDSTESQYSWNSLTPYLVFFVSLPIMVTSFSLANKAYIPSPELFVISLVMCGFCFVGLSDSHDLLTLVALGSHAFASLPIFLNSIPEIPILSQIIALITKPFFSLYLGVGVSFNFSLPALVHMLIPLLLFRMAMRGSWTGVYRILVPHLVCYFWFNVATTVFPFTSWTGLARATIGYILLPVLIPLSFFLSIGGILYGLYKLLQTQMIGKIIVTALLFAVPLLLTRTKMFVGKKGEKASPKQIKMKKVIMITFAVLGLLPLFFVQLPTLTEKKSLDISWEDYKEICLPGEDRNWAPYQIRCRDFLGTKVHWKGSVHQVKVSKVENTAESVIKALPTLLGDPLYCIYGEEIPECDEKSMTAKSFKHCQLITSMGRRCHLNENNQLSFSLDVVVEFTLVTLEAGSNFQSRLMALQENDELEFSGILVDVGKATPLLKLKSLNCTSRNLPVMMDVEDDVDEEVLIRVINEALALTFNFGLFPVLSYSAEN